MRDRHPTPPLISFASTLQGRVKGANIVVQHHRQLMQRRIAKAFGLDRSDGGENIFAVDAGLAVALPHEAQLRGQSASR